MAIDGWWDAGPGCEHSWVKFDHYWTLSLNMNPMIDNGFTDKIEINLNSLSFVNYCQHKLNKLK